MTTPIPAPAPDFPSPAEPDFTAALLATLESILRQPTAPFHEDAVAREIARQLAPLPHVSVERDPFGNLIARYACCRSGSLAHEPRWAFAVHMDHPGWVRVGADWEFLGGVPREYLDVRPPRREYGDFAMWDLSAFAVREGKVYSRACDDLVGCAALVAAFQELERTGAEGACLGLFTRAEEVGFVGAMELARSGLLPRDLGILSLETSAERPPAKMGEGVIVRVGDKTSIFDPAITAELAATAARTGFPFQRHLMPGGTCEATAYALYGYRCGALCVALGNYHNCGPARRIEPESVSLDDVCGLTALCVALAQPDSGESEAPLPALRARLETNFERQRKFFRELA